MIARTWKCIALPENVSKYVTHFEKTVLPELIELKGFREAFILQQPRANEVEITVMTVWESIASIHEFAGEHIENAVVEPAAQAVLKSFDTTVTHQEVILQAKHEIV